MTKYITKQEKVRDWVKKVIFDIGDGEPRSLNQLLAKANLEGFKRKEVLEILESYKELGEINLNLKKGAIISYKNIVNKIQADREVEAVINGEPVKEDFIPLNRR